MANTYSPELDGFWDVLKSIPKTLGKIKPEHVETAGKLVGTFRKGKKGGRKLRELPSGIPEPPTPATPGLGIDTTTLLLLLGGVGIVVYMMMGKK